MACLLVACHPIEPKSLPNQAELQPRCLASQSQCDFETELGRLAISFAQVLPPSLESESKQGIYGELPFSVVLNFNSVAGLGKIEKISAYMEGVDMFMGKVPVFFSESKPAQFNAESLLANCTEESMVWRLWVTFSFKRVGETDLNEQTIFVDFTGQRS